MTGLHLSSTGISRVLLVLALGAVGPPSGDQGSSGQVFGPRGRVITSGRIFSIASRDLDGDGRPDLVVSDYLNPARILYSDAGLGFKKVVPLTATAETATTGHGVALADFNGDARLDVFLVFNEFPARLLFGDGKGGFADSGRAIGARGLSGTSVEIADVDGDGDTDAFVTYYQERARLYLNDGAGVLSASDQTFFDGVVDGDGDADVVSLREDRVATIWLNERGRFRLRGPDVAVGEGVQRVALVDVDADRDLDLVALGRTTESAIWGNDGRGSFSRWKQTFGSGTRMAAGDLDLDGDTDLVIGSAVWLNRGGESFENVQTLPLGLTSVLELVDIDGDGDLDLLGAALDRATGRADLLLFLNTRRPYLSLPLRAEDLHEKLSFLQPLLGRPWQGEFPLADGKGTLPITQVYEPLWGGRVIRFTRSLPDFPFFVRSSLAVTSRGRLGGRPRE